MTHAKTFTAGALAALLALGSAPVVAQTSGSDGSTDTMPQNGTSESGGTTAEFSQDKIDAFVLAAVDLSEVRSEYQQKIAQAPTEDEKQQLAVEGQAKMAQAVEQADGITIEEYTEIGTAAQSDPELAQRLTMLIEEKMGNTDAPAEQADG
jgi:hypothetical protein